MMRFLIDGQRAGDVERDISPPFRSAITLPVTVDGKPTGVAIYVTVSRFADSDFQDEGLMIEVASALSRLGQVRR